MQRNSVPKALGLRPGDPADAIDGLSEHGLPDSIPGHPQILGKEKTT